MSVTFDVIDEGMTVDVIAEPPVVDIGVSETIVAVVTVSGPAGAQGQPGGTVQRLTAIALSGHRLVVPSGDGLAYADATNAAHTSLPVWLTDAAWEADTTAQLVSAGPVTEPTWNWTTGPIYVGTNGALTQSIPLGAAFIRVVAEVIDATTIMFQPFPPIAI